MKKYFILLLILFSSLQVRAQETGNTDQLILKFAPLSLIDPNRSVIQLGLEYKPVKWFGLQADYGQKFPFLKDLIFGKSARENHHYFTMRSEARFYFYRMNIADFYTALEGFYAPETYRLYNQTVIRDSIEMLYDYSDIKRKVYGSSIKFGILLNPSKKMRIDLYGGLGIRQRSIRHHTHIETPLSYSKFYEFFTPVELNEGYKTMPHISLGIKIGYAAF